MKKLIQITGIVLFTVLILVPFSSFAEDEGQTVTGKVSITGRAVSNRKDSAKFEEYRDLPSGASVDFELNAEDGDGSFLELEAEDIAEDSQKITLTGGKQGLLKLELEYDKTPHRFAYDAVTLFSGIGSENLELEDALQQDLQNSTTMSELTDSLVSYMDGASLTDIEIIRKKSTAAIEYTPSDPFTLTLEGKHENRDGTRPFSGSFGFSNLQEIAEPVDDETYQLTAKAEYAEGAAYLSLNYYLSIYENNLSTITWDNPMRVTDSTSPSAYVNPGGFGTLANDGPSRGLIDLAPDNIYNNASLAGSLGDLPFRSRISANASWGFMRQDEDLVASTTNTAIVPGAAHSPPYDASDAGNLPVSEADAAVDTQLYNVMLTADPLSFMDFKARWRYYEYDNNTDIVGFPGYTRFDAVWEDVPISNLPTGYKKNTFNVDLGFDIARQTDLGLGYRYEQVERTNREVEETDENALTVSLDSFLVPWLNLRTSYEFSKREVDGTYDPTVPFDGNEVIPQLPFLRKYDEADRERNQFNLLATVFPVDDLALTGSFSYSDDEFDESEFGLLDDQVIICSGDVDYSINEDLNVFAFYSYEQHESNQKDRQWTPGGIGDPFVGIRRLESNSNWEAKNEDTVHTVGAGLSYEFMPDRATFEVTYSLSDASGKVELASPLGTPLNDANPYVPSDFDDVDDTMIQTVNPKFTVVITEEMDLVIGYLYEKFEVDDFNKEGFANVPLTSSGLYNQAIYMGTLPDRDYEVSIGYARFDYKF